MELQVCNYLDTVVFTIALAKLMAAVLISLYIFVNSIAQSSMQTSTFIIFHGLFIFGTLMFLTKLFQFAAFRDKKQDKAGIVILSVDLDLESVSD